MQNGYDAYLCRNAYVPKYLNFLRQSNQNIEWEDRLPPLPLSWLQIIMLTLLASAGILGAYFLYRWGI